MGKRNLARRKASHLVRAELGWKWGVRFGTKNKNKSCVDYPVKTSETWFKQAANYREFK